MCGLVGGPPPTCPNLFPQPHPNPTHPKQEIILFRKQQLSYYVGNYDEYVQQVEERQVGGWVEAGSTLGRGGEGALQ